MTTSRHGRFGPIVSASGFALFRCGSSDRGSGTLPNLLRVASLKPGQAPTWVTMDVQTARSLLKALTSTEKTTGMERYENLFLHRMKLTSADRNHFTSLTPLRSSRKKAR